MAGVGVSGGSGAGGSVVRGSHHYGCSGDLSVCCAAGSVQSGWGGLCHRNPDFGTYSSLFPL